MVGALSRGLLLLAAFSAAMPTMARAAAVVPLGVHREDVDVSRYPWSAIGKLYNETGGSCSGVVIARDKVLTAAHCLFNYRTRHYIPAEALHFLVGYRVGRYSAHARIVRYEIGEGFDPLRYDATVASDWAVLTVTERLPAEIEPLRLSRDLAPSGTKAMIAGYPQDRAFAMTADRDCELRERTGNGHLFLHTCRGINGYSGAPILVSSGSREVRIAGIQIATSRGNAAKSMIAVPAEAIWRQTGGDGRSVDPEPGRTAEKARAACMVDAGGSGSIQLMDIQARLDADRLDLSLPVDEPMDMSMPGTMAWLAGEPIVTALR